MMSQIQKKKQKQKKEVRRDQLDNYFKQKRKQNQNKIIVKEIMERQQINQKQKQLLSTNFSCITQQDVHKLANMVSNKPIINLSNYYQISLLNKIGAFTERIEILSYLQDLIHLAQTLYQFDQNGQFIQKANQFKLNHQEYFIYLPNVLLQFLSICLNQSSFVENKLLQSMLTIFIRMINSTIKQFLSNFSLSLFIRSFIQYEKMLPLQNQTLKSHIMSIINQILKQFINKQYFGQQMIEALSILVIKQTYSSQQLINSLHSNILNSLLKGYNNQNQFIRSNQYQLSNNSLDNNSKITSQNLKRLFQISIKGVKTHQTKIYSQIWQKKIGILQIIKNLIDIEENLIYNLDLDLDLFWRTLMIFYVNSQDQQPKLRVQNSIIKILDKTIMAYMENNQQQKLYQKIVFTVNNNINYLIDMLKTTQIVQFDQLLHISSLISKISKICSSKQVDELILFEGIYLQYLGRFIQVLCDGYKKMEFEQKSNVVKNIYQYIGFLINNQFNFKLIINQIQLLYDISYQDISEQDKFYSQMVQNILQQEQHDNLFNHQESNQNYHQLHADGDYINQGQQTFSVLEIMEVQNYEYAGESSQNPQLQSNQDFYENEQIEI